MVIPVWFTLAFGILAAAYGAYRIWLGLRPAKSPDEGDDGAPRTRMRRGMFAMAPRTHLMFGVVYVLLGAALIATTFGWNPFGNLFLPRGETTLPTKLAPASQTPSPTPTPAQTPAPSTIPVETVPPAGSAGSAAPAARPQN